jgi:hypothetical protein
MSCKTSRLSSYASLLLILLLTLLVASRRLLRGPTPSTTFGLTHGDSLHIELPGLPSQPSAPPSLPRVLILTPVKDSARHLDRYFALLRNLSYPAHLLSLGMIDSDSQDRPSAQLTAALAAPASLAALSTTPAALAAANLSATLATLLLQAPSLLGAGWRRVTLARHNFGYSLDRGTRHSLSEQQRRREVLAKSRNHLLSSALQDEDWVLWLDSDLAHYPAELLQRLVGAAAPPHPAPPSAWRRILVPNCVLSLGGGRSYDLNSWRAGSPLSPGTNASVAAVVAYHNKHPGGSSGSGSGLAVEGYGTTGARYLHQFRLKEGGVPGGQGRPSKPGTVLVEAWEAAGADTVVRLDAVGGAALLVHAELHRHGLVFPSFPYRRRIETEGLSMMAMDMGVLSWGMPFLEVLHN